MLFIHEAYKRLFNKPPKNKLELSYSSRLKPYNANVKMYKDKILFTLSKSWEGVDEEIQIGVVQYLLLKILKKEVFNTVNIELYKLYIKNLSDVEEEKFQDPLLKERFDELNKVYLNNALTYPNLVFGNETYRTLGTYNFHTDTIRISLILKTAPIELLDYVLYHEMLHKLVKFNHQESNSRYHNREFRQLEQKMPTKELNKKLGEFIRNYKSKHRRF